jgi:hypothetical protein
VWWGIFLEKLPFEIQGRQEDIFKIDFREIGVKGVNWMELTQIVSSYLLC